MKASRPGAPRHSGVPIAGHESSQICEIGLIECRRERDRHICEIALRRLHVATSLRYPIVEVPNVRNLVPVILTEEGLALRPWKTAKLVRAES
jgi:hypothetical protein